MKALVYVEYAEKSICNENINDLAEHNWIALGGWRVKLLSTCCMYRTYNDILCHKCCFFNIYKFYTLYIWFPILLRNIASYYEKNWERKCAVAVLLLLPLQYLISFRISKQYKVIQKLSSYLYFHIFFMNTLEGARGFARLLGVNSKKTTKHVFNKIFLTVWI